MKNKIDLNCLLPKGVSFEPAFGSKAGYQRFRKRFKKAMNEKEECYSSVMSFEKPFHLREDGEIFLEMSCICTVMNG